MGPTPPEDYDRWLSALSADEIERLFRERGCDRVLTKQLAARQDNDKNQVYAANDLAAIAAIPSGETAASATQSRKNHKQGETKFTSPVNWNWLSPTGESPAPGAKLIYYPQYPEVRISGLLQGSPNPPRSLYARALRGQEAGRLLLVGTKAEASDSSLPSPVWALLLPPESVAAPRILDATSSDQVGAFHVWQLGHKSPSSTKDSLIHTLQEIAGRGWVAGQKLNRGGIQPYNAQNGGGYTLEALCGVAANGAAEPDFLGWELKAHGRSGRALTLFTPSPTLGSIKTLPPLDFMRMYGRPRGDDVMIARRWDFTGRHTTLSTTSSTGLRLALMGWDGKKQVDPDGGVHLMNSSGECAAGWTFARLIDHWKRKHARTAYVPYEAREMNGTRYYRYTGEVLLCTGTDFFKLLHGYSSGSVYYDPGLKLELRDTPNGPTWRPKTRHQFRVGFRNLPRLYDLSETVTIGPVGP
ncbi:MvaI/BcnI family restriction endonuclease [Kytococcus sp. HMSC28H12]|uniref:MvaI/BcnI family restriction endonuclease n=1 Tax=Kytococcus sp. HMSC28H12 TaxID=1581067 RepID=UPI0009F35997|nr:MvaI/BcnI family restriction endonuclease [Kytococcus sp. HMSC28H12]